MSNPCPVDDDPPDKHSFRKPVPRLGGGLVVAQMPLEQKIGRKFPGISEVWDRPVRSVTIAPTGRRQAFPSLFHNRPTVAPAVTFASMESCWCFNGFGVAALDRWGFSATEESSVYGGTVARLLCLGKRLCKVFGHRPERRCHNDKQHQDGNKMICTGNGAFGVRRGQCSRRIGASLDTRPSDRAINK